MCGAGRRRGRRRRGTHARSSRRFSNGRPIVARHSAKRGEPTGAAAGPKCPHHLSLCAGCRCGQAHSPARHEPRAGQQQAGGAFFFGIRRAGGGGISDPPPRRPALPAEAGSRQRHAANRRAGAASDAGLAQPLGASYGRQRRSARGTTCSRGD